MYRVTLTDRKTSSTTDLDFYAFEDRSGGESLAMNRPERLEVVVNQEKFQPGQTAKVLVRSPLPGTLLLTLETDRVVWSQVARGGRQHRRGRGAAAGGPPGRGVPAGLGRPGGRPVEDRPGCRTGPWAWHVSRLITRPSGCRSW